MGRLKIGDSFVVSVALLFAMMLASGCGTSSELDCRHEGAACAAGFVCAETTSDVWRCSPLDEEDGGSNDGGDADEEESRAHRFIWVTAQRDVSIDAIEWVESDGETHYVAGLYQCPTGPDSQHTCGNLDGPPRGCGVDTSHRIPRDRTLIADFVPVIESGDTITVYLCDEPAPADAISVQIGVEGYQVVGNPLISCPLEGAGDNARCTVPELPPIVEVDPHSHEQALLDYFEAEPRDPMWSVSAEQTIRDNITNGITTDGESIFEILELGTDEWCVESWGTWELDVDCRTTMCRVTAIGGSIVQTCLQPHLHDFVPFGGSAHGSWETDRWIEYFSREGYDLPRF